MRNKRAGAFALTVILFFMLGMPQMATPPSPFKGCINNPPNKERWIHADFEIVTTDLGTINGTENHPIAINNLGQVTGWSYIPPRMVTHAFVWTAADGMIDLGTLGGSESYSVAINDLGHVIGDSRTSSWYTHAFVWTATDGMIDLGTLGGSESYSVAINDLGQVIGWSQSATLGEAAFVWNATHGMIDLGTLGGNTVPVAINELGQVTGKSEVNIGGSWYDHAFFWNATHGMIDLGTLGGAESYPIAINDMGQVIGNSQISSGAWHGFIWTAADGMIDLGFLDSDPVRPIAINNLGQVIGWGFAASGGYHAIIWTDTDGIIDLGTLGSDYSLPVAINDLGQVTGWSFTISARHTFLWNATHGMIDLGTLGGAESYPIAINDLGQVTGWSYTESGATHAFLWTAADGMIDLGTLGGYSSESVAINDLGQAIGKSQTEGGVDHGVLWTYHAADDIPPSIDHPQDVQYLQGAQGQQIFWTPYDYNPDTYSITRNGEVVMSGPWSGESILVQIDGLQPGEYTFECTVYDASGNSASDSVQVEVTSQGPVWGLAPTDQIIPYGEQFDYQITAIDILGVTEIGIDDWWINDTLNFELSATFDGERKYSTASIKSRAVLPTGSYGLEVIVTDMEGFSVTGTFQVVVIEEDAAQVDLDPAMTFVVGTGIGGVAAIVIVVALARRRE